MITPGPRLVTSLCRFLLKKNIGAHLVDVWRALVSNHMKSSHNSRWHAGGARVSHCRDINVAFLLCSQLISSHPSFPPPDSRFLNSILCSLLFSSQTLSHFCHFNVSFRQSDLTRSVLNILVAWNCAVGTYVLEDIWLLSDHCTPAASSPAHPQPRRFHFKSGRIWTFTNFYELHYFEDKIANVILHSGPMGPRQVIISWEELRRDGRDL